MDVTEVVGKKCKHPNFVYQSMTNTECPDCHGTGTITRPATVEDIFRVFKILMEDGLTEVNMGEHGMLRVKE